MEQQEPPDADQGAGGDVPGDGVPGVGGGQLVGERGSDGLWRPELVDRRFGGLVFGTPMGDLVGDGVVESVAELGQDPRAAPTWAAQQVGELAQVRVDPRLHTGPGRHGQAVAGHARPPRTAVTAVENWSQIARCSPRAACPDGVRW